MTCAHELNRLGREALVLEKDSIVGGISRTETRGGYRVDIGGHRFFSKIPEVVEFWQDVLGDDLLTRPRLSRIFYQGRFFDYPLKPFNAVIGLGPVETVRIGSSYVWARLFPTKEEKTFEQWVSNRFGRRLFQIFFKTYTEKVWGMPCSEISADWAAQRIRNLDLRSVVRHALTGIGKPGETIPTLIERFHYPRLGPGMMWEACRDRLAEKGVETRLDAQVVELERNGDRVLRAVVETAAGDREVVEAENYVSSMPLRSLVRCIRPLPPRRVLEAADSLRYRDYLTVVLAIDSAQLFPDNWIYIHAPEVKVGRIQNYKNWSPEMVTDSSKTALGLEYFVQEGDEVWSSSDEALVELGRSECVQLGLVREDQVLEGWVIRMPKAYPVYDDAYQEAVETIRTYLDGLSNLEAIGRNGLHRYNNQDHSMVTGIYAARNIAGDSYDVWAVNVDKEYHEAGSSERLDQGPEKRGERLVPQRVEEGPLEALLTQAFARYDPVALGAGVSTAAASVLFAATAVLLLRGDEPLGPTLSLLGHYLLGYEVSWAGALLGAFEAGVLGFALGWVMAKSMNTLVSWYETGLRRRLQLVEVMDPSRPPEGGD